jgi:hypothetical protein
MRPDPVNLLLDTLRFHQTPDADGLASRWQRVDLWGLPQLIQFEGCEVWLYQRMSNLALLEHVDGRLADFLARRTRLAGALSIRVDAQRDALVEFLNEPHTPHVLLKGCAYRLLGDRYPYLDARMTGDVDVLLPGRLAPSTWDRLKHAGFHVATSKPDFYEEHHHLVPLAGERRVIVELHTSTDRGISPTEAWDRMDASGREMACPGGRTKVPSTTELFWHAVSHALHDPQQAFRLRSLQDAATIWASDEEIDWRAVAARLDSHELQSPMLARRWLGAAGSLAGRSPIAERLAGGAPPFQLHRALRWRLSALRGGAWVRNVFARDPLSRARRFAIDVGTATDLGLQPKHTRWQRKPLGRVAVRIAGATIRMGYLAWQAWEGRQPRRPKGQTGQEE